jgi:hypothetical protein
MIIRILWALLALFLTGFLIYESVKYGWAMGGTILVFALLPDIALIAAFDRTRRGMLRPGRVGFYNVMHRPWAALVLLVSGALVVLPPVGGVNDGGKLVAAAGLAWLAHIAADRASGYGLRDAGGAVRPVGGTRRPAWCST